MFCSKNPNINPPSEAPKGYVPLDLFLQVGSSRHPSGPSSPPVAYPLSSVQVCAVGKEGAARQDAGAGAVQLQIY